MAVRREDAGSLPGPAPRFDAWRIIGPGGGGTMIDPTVSPHSPDVVVEHCDMTGSYITTDGGRSWRMFHLRGVVQTFAFDPGDPDVIYAGNMALWKSEDLGKTWSMILPDPGQNTLEHGIGDHASTFYTSDDPRMGRWRISVQALAVDPGDSNRLYMVSGWRRAALYTSRDRGGTWELTKRLERERFISLHVHANRGASRLHLATSRGIHVGTGDDWEFLPGPPGEDIQYAGMGSGKNPEAPNIYVLVGPGDIFEPYCTGAYTSSDGGMTWQEVTDRVASALPATEESGSIRLRAVAAPSGDGETAYVGFVRFGEGGRHAASGAGVIATGIIDSGIAKTADGGESWQVVLREAGAAARNSTPSWVEGRKPDHSIWLDAPVSLGVAPADGRVCYATDLFRTYRTLDGGESWETVNSVKVGEQAWTTRGLDVTTCYGVHSDPFDTNRLYISYTDIGLFRSEDGGESWIGSTEGIPNDWRNTTYWIVLDPEVEGLIWGVFSGTHDIPRPKMWTDRRLEGYTGGVAVSRDGGKSWTVANEGMPETAACHILMDPESPAEARTLYVCGFGTGVYKSVDSGKTWALKNQGIEGEEPFAFRIIRAGDGALYLVVARRSQDGSIGTDEDGALYRSTDQADTWTKMKLPDGCNGPVGLAIDPRDDRRLYLATWGRMQRPDDVDGGVYLSTDGGESWRNVLSESQHVHDVTIDPRNPDVLYAVGFDQGVWRSSDAGETWNRIKGFNFKWAVRVIPDPVRPNMIYVCTYGGSVWHGPAEGDPNAVEDIVPPIRRGTAAE